MSIVLATDLLPLITLPSNDPYVIYHFFLHHTPTADLTYPNYTLSSNDALSSLTYAFATTPESSHPWLVFKLVQWEALRANAEVNIPALVDLSPFAFPPDPYILYISKTIVDLWNALDPAAIFEWHELTRDVHNAYVQLFSRFGNGVEFDGNAWENQRYYHARSLFFKWKGHQSMHSTTPIIDPEFIYAPVSLTQAEPNVQFVDSSFYESTNPYVSGLDGTFS